MDLEKAINTLKPIVKQSTALDESLHIDLTLISAAKRSECEHALKIIYKNINEKLITRDEILEKIFK